MEASRTLNKAVSAFIGGAPCYALGVTHEIFPYARNFDDTKRQVHSQRQELENLDEIDYEGKGPRAKAFLSNLASTPTAADGSRKWNKSKYRCPTCSGLQNYEPS